MLYWFMQLGSSELRDLVAYTSDESDFSESFKSLKLSTTLFIVRIEFFRTTPALPQHYPVDRAPLYMRDVIDEEDALLLK